MDEFIDDTGNLVSHVMLPEITEEILKFARRRCPFRQSTVILKKSAVLAAGGYRDFWKHEDYDLIMQMLNAKNNADSGKAYNVQEVLT